MYFEDTPKNQYCLNCSYSYVIDEDDKLYCPFRGSKPIQNDGWCKKWNNDEKLNNFLLK